MKTSTFIFILVFIFNNTVHADTMQVRHGIVDVPEDSRQAYILNLLKLSLQKTEDTYGSYDLVPIPHLLTPERSLESVKNNELIDILTSITTTELEKDLLPIRIPLFKGLIGYRVFIIKAEKQALFNAVNTLDDLRQFQAGQATGWPDTEILRENHMPVIAAFEYQSLFEMLRYERFDYFPRSIMEVYKEVSIRHDLTIENSLALYYPAAFYFFVNKNNKKLAERIELGLERAIEDGSFDRLLLKDTGSSWAMKQLANHDRVIFPLTNTTLPVTTPLDTPEYWYFPIKQ